MSAPARPRHQCEVLFGEAECFECGNPVYGGAAEVVGPAADPLADLVGGFDEDAYFDGLDL